MNELIDVLNRGEGIAIICALIRCPNCNKHIWVEHGYHCGYDAVLESYLKDEMCYKCYQSFNFDLDIFIPRQIKFMTVTEHSSLPFTYKRFPRKHKKKLTKNGINTRIIIKVYYQNR